MGEIIMKKFCALITAALSVSVLACTANAAEFPAKAEVLYPQRVYIANAQSLVPVKKLVISDVGSAANTKYPGATSDRNLFASLDSIDNCISSRNIHTYNFDTKSDVDETYEENLTGTYLRFRMNGDWDGTYRWKCPFTYEFDFTVNTLDNFYMMKIGNAGVKFLRDPGEENKFVITWDGDEGESAISGQQCEFGKTYNIRIEADVTAGQGVFTIFTDPETGFANTSYKEHGQTFTEEQYATDTKRCPVSLDSKGRVQIETANENMFYESYFIRAHSVDVSSGAAVEASATVLNSVDKARSAVPYLFLGIYDSNGAMVASTGRSDGEVAKQSTEGAEKLDSAPFTYKVSISAADLPDGEYTARSSLWRDKNISFVCGEVVEKAFRVEGGAVSEIN